VILTMTSCEKDEMQKRDYPRVRTLAVTDINEEGATVHGEIISLGQGGVDDCGFVWSTSYSPTLDYSERVSLGPVQETGHFSAQISTTLKANKTYKVRSYIKNEDYIVYGTIVEFISLGSGAPQIDNIEPSNGTWLDTIKIKGRNFSYQNSQNVVLFNTIFGEVISSTDTVISVKVPLLLLSVSSNVSVSIIGNKTTSSTPFTLNPPIIDNISPTSGFDGDTITVYGKNFYPYEGKNFFTMGASPGLPCTVSLTMRDMVKIIVPPVLPNGLTDLSISILEQEFTSEDIFYVNSPNITSIDPIQGTFNDTIEIRGIWFHPEIIGNKVLIDNIECEILSYSDSLIEAVVPTTVTAAQSDIAIIIKSTPYAYSDPFILLAPMIENISPGAVTFGDQITIYGKNFNPIPERNILELNNINIPVIEATSTYLIAEVPYYLVSTSGIVNVELTIGENSTNTVDKLSLFGPVITDLTPDQGIVGEELVITGDYFNPDPSFTEVSIGVYYGEIIESNKTSIKVIIPLSADPAGSQVSVRVNGQTCTAATEYELLEMSVTDITPSEGSRGSTIAVTGNNFSSNLGDVSVRYNRAFLGDDPLTLVSCSTNELVFRFKDNYGLYSEGMNNLKIEVGLQSVTFPSPINFLEPWSKITDFGGGGVTQAVSFAISGKGYVGTGYIPRIAFWEYDPDLDVWTQKANYAGYPTYAAYGFAVNNKGYIGNGYLLDWSDPKQFWEYDPLTNQWTRKTDFPGSITYKNPTFVIGSNGYVVDGNSRLWEYNPSNDTWTQLVNYPKSASFGIQFGINDKGYVGLGYFTNELWEYDQALNQWTQKASGPACNHSTGFSVDGYGYVVGGDDTERMCWRYDPVLNQWKQIMDVPLSSKDAVAFEIDNIIYYGTSVRYSSRIDDFWRFDPSKVR